MARAFVLVLSLALIALVGLAAYVLTGNATGEVRQVAESWGAPVSDDHTPRIFTVKPGMSARDIGAELERQKLIRSALAFRVLVDQQGAGAKIQAGDYELSPSMTTEEVVALLASGRVKRGTPVTVVEGWRAEEIGARLQVLHLATADDFLRLVRDPSGLDVPADLKLDDEPLDGFLFPATYDWDARTGVQGLVTRMVEQFDLRVDPDIRAGFARQHLTLRQAVTLASIVEREAKRPEERPIIASVYLNRLKQNMLLQADPTVQYAIADANLAEAARDGFWPVLRASDVRIASPYNTYAVKGLPPGPICNPGLDSLKAVAAPAETDYLYFMARGDGSHAFARTAEEHAQNVQKYSP